MSNVEESKVTINIDEINAASTDQVHNAMMSPPHVLL